MADYEFSQKVMAAAGVETVPASVCTCRHDIIDHLFDDGAAGPCIAQDCGCEKWTEASMTSDPLAPEGHAALWDALEAKGWLVDIETLHTDEGGLRYLVDIWDLHDDRPSSCWRDESSDNRFAALLNAAAQALGVSRG